jgi:hypothetical protein
MRKLNDEEFTSLITVIETWFSERNLLGGDKVKLTISFKPIRPLEVKVNTSGIHPQTKWQGSQEELLAARIFDVIHLSSRAVTTATNFFTIGHLARWAKYQGSMGGCGNITRNHILTALEAVGVPLDPPTPLGGKEQEKIFGLPINKLFSSRACWHRFADAEMVEDVTRRYCNTIGALVETVNDPEKLVVLEEQLKSVMGASRYTFGLTHLQDAVKRLITSQ